MVLSRPNIRYISPYLPYLLKNLLIWVKSVTYFYEPYEVAWISHSFPSSPVSWRLRRRRRRQGLLRLRHYFHPFYHVGEWSSWTGSFEVPYYGCELELELELIQTQMTQKPMLRAEVGMRVRCANKASAE